MAHPRDIVELLRLPGKVTRLEVADLYGASIADHWNELGAFNWKAVNERIIERWSVAGLEYIKRKAWKQADWIRRGLPPADDAVDPSIGNTGKPPTREK